MSGRWYIFSSVKGTSNLGTLMTFAVSIFGREKSQRYLNKPLSDNLRAYLNVEMQGLAEKNLNYLSRLEETNIYKTE